MHFLSRIARHARISWNNLGITNLSTSPFLIFFITSVCNMRCGHCFYWKNLNKCNDLTMEEIIAFSSDLGRIENLNLSGGEPFMRKEIAEICRCFIRNNHVKQIYIPTNAFFTKKILQSIRLILQEQSLKILAIEISLDGMAEFHDQLRGCPNSFLKAMETYDALAEFQNLDPRLRIHAVSTVNTKNIEEIKKLTAYLYQRCQAMDHHNIALIRGDRKNLSLQGPDLLKYQNLYRYVSQLWAPREKGRFGSLVEPMLQWAKIHTAKNQKQMVPCRAGVLSGVVYANGDVGFCETLAPLGNLRQSSFKEIWYSEKANVFRRRIHRKECYCTNEIFLWPSIVFQPWHLTCAMLQAKAWKMMFK